MWYMAFRRILGLQRLEIKLTCTLVWLEDLLPFIVLGSFIAIDGFWPKLSVAIASATGGMIGALVLMLMEKKKRRNGSGYE